MRTADKILEILHNYGLKKIGENKYQCNSPLRPGSNSHAFSLVIDPDGEHGAYHDFVSEEKGSLYELATLLGIAPQEHGAAASFTPPKSYRNLADYAEQHGCHEAEFRAAGWREVTEQNRPALVFRTKTGERYRFLDGNKPKFWHSSTYKHCWYGKDRAIDMAVDTRKPLVLCNGETSTVVAQYYGIPACCITGGGEREIPQYLMDELKESWSGDVIAALDCDKKGKMATPKLVRQLIGEGFNAWGVDLGGNGGFDLADFCLLWNAEAWERLPALPPIREGVALGKSGRELMLKQFPDIAWIVPGLLPEGLSICAGKPKLGKSWLWLNIGIAVAAGGYALGTIKVPQCNVLYLSLEDGERRLQKRIKELGYDHVSIPPNFEYEDTLPRLDDGAITLIDEWIKSKERTSSRYNLVIIDTLVMVKRAQRGGISIYDQDYDGLSGLRTMGQTHHGTAILMIHHTKKGDASDIFDMMTGSTGLQGVVESEMILYKLSEQVWIEVKGKDVEETKIPLRFDKELRQWIVVEDRKQLQMTPERSEIVEYLEDVGKAGPCEIAKALGIPYNNVIQTVKRLRDDGLIVSPKRGSYTLAEFMTHDSHDSHDSENIGVKKVSHESHESHDVMNSDNGLLMDVPPLEKVEHMYGRGD